MRRILFAAAVFSLLPAFLGCGASSPAFGAAKERGRRVTVTDPGVLDRGNTEYVLAADIVAEGTAFVVEGSNITLDLDGHEIVYGAGGGDKVYGVSVPGYHRKQIRIVNGRITQKKGSGCRGDQHSAGCNPIHIPNGVDGLEIAQIDIAWESPNTSALYSPWGKNADVHHNRFLDRGSRVDNRHQGTAVIEGNRGGNLRIHNNTVERARQIGIRAGEKAEIFENDIAIDSVVTNSTGIAVKSGVIRNNRVVGRGVHPIGIWPGNDTRVEGNYVNVRSTRTGDEYGSTGAACLRMTWGNDRVEVVDNIFILEASEGKGGEPAAWGRALWVGLPHKGEKALFDRNLIVANNRRGEAKAAAIAVVCNNESPGLVFKGNTVISNWGNVLLADDYGHADGYPLFVGNTFVRQDDYPGYRTVRSEYPERPSTAVFIDNRYLNGAGKDKIDLPHAAGAKKELRFGQTVEIRVTDGEGKPVPGADVQVESRAGKTAFSGKTDPNGVARAEIAEYTVVPPPVSRSSAPSGAVRKLIRREEGPFVLSVRKGNGRADRAISSFEENVGIRLDSHGLSKGGGK